MHIPSFGLLIHRTLLSMVNIVCLLPTRLQDDAQKKDVLCQMEASCEQRGRIPKNY